MFLHSAHAIWREVIADAHRFSPASSRGAKPRLRASIATASLAALVLLLACSASYAQDDSDFQRWNLALGIGYGKPSGHVQVRENQIEGTRLDFGSGLGVDHMSNIDLRVGFAFDADRSVQLVLQNFDLTGSTPLSQEVNFNGATFAAGTRLKTVTRFPAFLRATLFYQQTLVHFGNGGTFSGRGGFTFDALNFKLNGTLTADSVGRETKEDFVTQELPIPMLGVKLDEPINDRLHFIATLDAAWLPRVNSLRTEGGEVKLAQSNLDTTLGLDYALTRSLHLTGGYYFSYLKQDEQSSEDGNRILLKDNAAEIGLAYTF